MNARAAGSERSEGAERRCDLTAKHGGFEFEGRDTCGAVIQSALTTHGLDMPSVKITGKIKWHNNAIVQIKKYFQD